MKRLTRKVGATGKTHVAELLERVAKGESITITRHGKDIAMLVPVKNNRLNPQQAAERSESCARVIDMSGIAHSRVDQRAVLNSLVTRLFYYALIPNGTGHAQ